VSAPAEGRRWAAFSHRECEYYPCHPGADPDDFNCLFCYCPLYALGRDCGGDFTYTPAGIKDCSTCLRPHARGGYEFVTARFGDIVKRMEEMKK